MKRWWLWMVLLLSLGVNVGILLTLAAGGGEKPGAGAGSPGAEGPPGTERPRDPEGRGPELGPGPDGPPEAIPFLQRLADRFGLEGADRELFLKLQQSFFRRVLDTRRQGAALQRELGRELTAAEPDRERIEELIDELAQSRREMDRALAQTILESRELLDGPSEIEYLGFVRRLRERMTRDREGPPRRRPRPRGRPAP